MRANRLLDPVEKLSIFLEEGLCVLAPLADPLRIIAEPGARFFHEPGLHAQVQDFADLGDAFAIHDVELHLLERRSDLVLHHLHPRGVAYNPVAVLSLPGATNSQTARSIEFHRIHSSRRFRLAVHDTSLHTTLVL